MEENRKEPYCIENGTLVIPEGVTAIAPGQFKGALGIREVVFPESVTEIGERAFWLCENLERVHIPSNVEKVGRKAFFRCSKLASVEFDASVALVEECRHTDIFDELRTGGGVAEVAQSAFKLCGKLREYDICGKRYPNTASSSFAFEWAACDALGKHGAGIVKEGVLRTVKLDDNQTVFVVPDGVEEIASDVFHLHPDKAGNKGKRANRWASQLAYIVLPASVRKIDDLAFKYCRGLEYIIVEDELPEFGNMALVTCNCFQGFVGKDGKMLFSRLDAINRGIGFF